MRHKQRSTGCDNEKINDAELQNSFLFLGHMCRHDSHIRYIAFEDNYMIRALYIYKYARLSNSRVYLNS